MESCLYRGTIRHYRPSPSHGFQYSTSWYYLDLEEIDRLLQSRWLLSHHRWAPACFRRADHLGDPKASMSAAVADLVADRTGIRLDGPIRLLTQLRHFGLYFSPLNIFYCFDRQQSLDAMVAEVSNTPWNERHVYVLWEGNRTPGESGQYVHAKEFHVSPFMGMDSTYHWRLQPPAEDLRVSLGCCRDGESIFQADLVLSRSELTDAQLLRSLLRRPVAAVHVIGAIYYQALRLWMKKCPFYPHPRRSVLTPSTARRPTTPPRAADPVSSGQG